MKTYYVYIMISNAGILYTGFTNDLKKRVFQHKSKINDSFTKKYNVTSLVYYEIFSKPESGITREKQIKSYRREKKAALIDSINPRWEDLSADWYEKSQQ